MDALIIEATENSPLISFDTESKIFEIVGESRPENVREFYEPILNWMDDCGTEMSSNLNDENNATPITFNFKLEYFNSSSSKFILDIVKKIYDYHTKGIKIKVNWFFDEGDEDMQEAGEELSKMVKFPFEYVEITE